MSLALELERRLVNAWPSFEIELAGGWLLRFAEGYSKRANAATPIVPGAVLDPDLVDAVATSYEARGLPACFRLTGLEDAGVDGLLDRSGYASFEPSLTLTVALSASSGRDPSLVLSPVPKPAWVAAAAAAYGGEKANAEILGRILRRIRQPAAFATLNLDGEPAAWGFAVAERGFVGIYDVVVGPDLRGLGLGRRLVAGLLGWGQASGARTGYLQLRERNEVALALYRSLGFDVAYRYHHRVPAGARLSDGEAASSAPATVSAQAAASDGVASA